MSGTGSQSQIHANPSDDDSCSEDASKIHASIEFMPDSEEEVCIPQMPVKIPLSTFGMFPANRSGQRPDAARTERLLRSVQQTVQFSNIDEKPMMVIQAAATYSIARKGERSTHWAKESHGETRERYTVKTLATYPTDAESWKTDYVVIKGNHLLLASQALVSESKKRRGHRRTTSSPGSSSEAHTYPSSSIGDRDFYPASQGSDVETDAAVFDLISDPRCEHHREQKTENLYLELDHDDALDAAGLKDDGGPDAEQFLDRRRGARASTT